MSEQSQILTPNDMTSQIEELIGKPINTSRPFTHQDIVYLLNKYPFIQIANTLSTFENAMALKILRADSGWNIMDYGDALCSSAGEYMFGGANYESFIQKILDGRRTDVDSGDDGSVNPGKGTIIKQTYDTTNELIDLAICKGWSGIELIDGTPLMAQFLWLICEEKGVALEGYTPDEQDEANAKRKKRVKQLLAQAPEIKEIIQPD